MATIGNRRRRYRNLHHRRDRKLSPPIIIAICVAAALVVSILVGNLLRVFLDDDAYRRLVEKKEETKITVDFIRTNIPDIHAAGVPFDAAEDTITNREISVCINDKNGTLSYTSPVSEQFCITDAQASEFASCMQILNRKTTYISGVFHSRAFLQETTDLQYAVAVRERALIAEFLRGGGNDVLLCSVDAKQAVSYVKAIKSDLPTAVIGVALSPSELDEHINDALVPTLLDTCDFCAVDLRDVSVLTAEEAYSVLKEVSFYLLTYDMRLVLSADQDLLIEQLSQFSVSDYQIVAHDLSDTKAI